MSCEGSAAFVDVENTTAAVVSSFIRIRLGQSDMTCEGTAVSELLRLHMPQLSLCPVMHARLDQSCPQVSTGQVMPIVPDKTKCLCYRVFYALMT